MKCLSVAIVQYAQEVQCINAKFSEKLNEDERSEMKLTGSVLTAAVLRTIAAVS